MSDETPRAIHREDLAQFRARVHAYRALKEAIGACYQIRFEDYVRFEDFSAALDEYDRAKQENFIAETWQQAWANPETIR